jgi:hypothetical protein
MQPVQPVLQELERMSDARFLALYEALSDQGFGPLDGEVAKKLKFRPQAIRKLPMAQRAKRARSLLLHPGDAELAYEFFGSYLVRNRREIIKGFLDATGVAHEEGMIEDLEAAAPAPDKIEASAAELDRAFDPDDVTLYLSMCAQQWPGVPLLRELWSKRSQGNGIGPASEPSA